MSQISVSKPLLAIVVPSICRDGGGVSEAVRLLTESLHSDGSFRLVILTLKTTHFEEDRRRFPPVQILAVPYYGPARYGFSPGILLSLFRIKPDLIHVHGIWMFHCAAVHFYSRLKRKPYIVSPHGMLEAWILQRSKKLKKLVSRLYQNNFLHRADAYHALTSKEVLDIAEISPRADRGKIKEIPNFVKILDLPAVVGESSLNLSRSERTYLFFGRIHEKKGWRELLDAWGECCRTNQDFKNFARLVFAGWIDESPDFIDSLQALESAVGNVVYVGPKIGEERDALLSAADVFVLPSKSEGLPMVVLEAWAASLPTLITEECNLPQSFTMSGSIRIGKDSNAIAVALLESFRWSNDELQARARAARVYVSAKYSREEITAKFKEVYSSLLRGVS